MQAKNLLDILTRQGFRKEGDALLAPNTGACSVYLGFGDDALIIDRVSAIEVAAEVAIVVTQRKERYAVEVTEIRAVRVTPESAGPGYR